MPSPPSSSDDRALLRVYVNDHRAGAVAGLSLARRCLENNTRLPLGDELRAIVVEIEDDARTLEAFARRQQLRPDTVKRVAAAVGERVARLKPNGRAREYSPLSRLLEV